MARATGRDCETVMSWAGSVADPVRAPWKPRNACLPTAPDTLVGPGQLGQTTLQAGIDHCIRQADATGDTRRYTIPLEPGFYPGPCIVPATAPPLTIIGPSRDSAILAARIDAQMPGSEYATRFGAQFENSPASVQAAFARIAAREVITTGNSAVLRIERDDTIVSGLSVENLYACDRSSAAPEGDTPDAQGRFAHGQHQAVAVHVAGADRVQLEKLRMSSFQDTLYLQTPSPTEMSRVFLFDCLIEGDVDFIFGGATAFFDNCEIRARGERGAPIWVTAPSTNIHTPQGFVFDACRFTHDGHEGGRKGGSYLGRQWFEGVRATPYGNPHIADYTCVAADVSQFNGTAGSISRQTLEAVGKCVVQNSDISGHIDANTPWDGWNTPEWNPRFRPAQHSAQDFLNHLESWLKINALDYSDLDPAEPWLDVLNCQFLSSD